MPARVPDSKPWMHFTCSTLHIAIDLDFWGIWEQTGCTTKPPEYGQVGRTTVQNFRSQFPLPTATQTTFTSSPFLGLTTISDWGGWKRHWGCGRNDVRNRCLFHASHRQSGPAVSLHDLWGNLQDAPVSGQGGEPNSPVTQMCTSCQSDRRCWTRGFPAHRALALETLSPLFS